MFLVAGWDPLCQCIAWLSFAFLFERGDGKLTESMYTCSYVVSRPRTDSETKRKGRLCGMAGMRCGGRAHADECERKKKTKLLAMKEDNGRWKISTTGRAASSKGSGELEFEVGADHLKQRETISPSSLPPGVGQLVSSLPVDHAGGRQARLCLNKSGAPTSLKKPTYTHLINWHLHLTGCRDLTR